MDRWKDHKIIILLNELPKPFLAVWFFVKEIVFYIIELFSISWESLSLSMDRNIIFPGFIAASLSLFIFNLYGFINLRINIESIFPIFLIISLLPISWGFAVIACVNQSKGIHGNTDWKNYIRRGFKSVKFFFTYSLFIVFILFLILGLSSVGLIPQIGQSLLAFLSSPFFFITIVLILSIVSLLVGSILFGGYYLSEEYNNSSSFIDRTKSLFLMLGKKIIDFIGVSIPGLILSSLYILIPVLLMVLALEVLRAPSEGVYGINFPGLRLSDLQLESKTFHKHYPDEDIVESKQKDFDYKKYELDLRQNEYNAIEKSSSISLKSDQYKIADSLLNKFNSESWSQSWSYLDKFPDKLKFGEIEFSFEEYDDWTEERWIVDKNHIKYFETMEEGKAASWILDQKNKNQKYDKGEDFIDSNGNNKWNKGEEFSDKAKVEFSGEYDYSFFIWLTDIILVIANSIILAFPFSFFFGALGTIYYKMYNTNFRINILKKIIGIVLLVIVIDYAINYLEIFLI